MKTKKTNLNPEACQAIYKEITSKKTCSFNYKNFTIVSEPNQAPDGRYYIDEFEIVSYEANCTNHLHVLHGNDDSKTYERYIVNTINILEGIKYIEENLI